MGKVRNSYTASEKLAAIRYADANGNRAAGVDESVVRSWRWNRSKIETMPKTKKAARGSAPKYPEMEKELLAWIQDRRRQGIAVTTVEMRLKAKLIAKQQKIDIKASVKWAYLFMRRARLSVRRRTHIAQKLPEDYDDKLLEFQKFIINERKIFNFSLSQIGNADQTPLTFDMPQQTTIAATGSKNITINTTGNEKNRFTIMLACTADGGKLPPYVIFKRKTMPKGVTWPKGIHVRVQEKGWMDEKLTLDWAATVWGQRPGGLSHKSLLVLDAFRCHKSDKVKAALRDQKTRLAIIPGGMTSILQPLDVSVNKPMKTLLRQKWNDWYAGDSHTFTAGGKMRKPELPEITQWIVDCWQAIDPAIIIKAFKKCCISNSMDGTEDDILWEEDSRSSATSLDTEREDTDEDTDDEDSVYTDRPGRFTHEQILKIFDSSDDDSEFEGFDKWDIPIQYRD